MIKSSNIPTTKTVKALNSSKKSRLKGAKLKRIARHAVQPADAESKLGCMIALLRRSKGASIGELCKATGWQAHSIRGALSGAVKKKLKLKIMSAKTGDMRIYRIAE